MESMNLVGSWHLKKFFVTDKTGVTREWQQGCGEGLLIYSSDGHMSVSINAEPATLQELAEHELILQRCLFYAGTYEVNETEVTHRVMFATSGQRIGEEMKRAFHLSNDQLTLKAFGEYGSSELIWERASQVVAFTKKS